MAATPQTKFSDFQLEDMRRRLADPAPHPVLGPGTWEPVVDRDVASFEWLLVQPVWTEPGKPDLSPRNVLDDMGAFPEHAAAIRTADMSFPILLVERETPDERGSEFVVDGMHRVCRAVLEGRAQVRARVIPPEIMRLALVSDEGTGGAPAATAGRPARTFNLDAAREYDVEKLWALTENLPVPVAVAGHVDHCLYQLYRFADGAERGGEFRAMQFGLNLGRLQEMLGSHGGPGMWWRPFEALVLAKNWAAVKGLVNTYCDVLGRKRPALL